jgi:transmembrane sensor
MRPSDDEIRDWLRTQNDETFDTDAAWQRFSAAHGLAQSTGTRKAPLRISWRIAAAALIAVGIGGAWWTSRSTRATDHTDQIVVATRDGERRLVTFADGSSVTLNGGSRLGYSASSRAATLEGEAMFEIRHDAARPFTVHARRGLIRDVGTRFSVRAYENQVDVGVSEGSVEVSGNTAGSITLTAGQSASVDSAGGVRRANENVESLAGWVSGDLVLDDVPLASAARSLERTYGVRVVVGDSTLARRHVTARFHKESVTGALDGIALALGVAYEKRDSAYVIRSRGNR